MAATSMIYHFQALSSQENIVTSKEATETTGIC